MKKILYTATAILSFGICFAQDIKVRESNENFSNGNHNALSVTIFNNDKSAIEKAWKRLMKDFNPDKTSDSKGEYFFDNATFKAVSNNTIDVYSRVSEKNDKTTELVVIFDLGGAYLNSSEHKDQFDYFKKLLSDFAVNLTKEALNEELKQASKVFENIGEKKNSLEKDNKNLNDDITDYNDKIAKSKDKIEKNKTEIEVKKKELETQQQKIEAIKLKIQAVK